MWWKRIGVSFGSGGFVIEGGGVDIEFYVICI